MFYSARENDDDVVEKVIKAQEEERRRVARDIHDGPAQMMANAVLQVEILERLIAQNPRVAASELNDLKRLINDSLKELRRIIFDLRPMILDDLGLAPALRRYTNDFTSRHSLPVEMKIIGVETRIDPIIEVALFRIVQEALHNTRKHALASRVVVTLGYGPDAVSVSIEDNGKGFNPGGVWPNWGHSEKFGLSGMRERAKLFGGSLHIDSAPGEGTKITARIPVAR